MADTPKDFINAVFKEKANEVALYWPIDEFKEYAVITYSQLWNWHGKLYATIAKTLFAGLQPGDAIAWIMTDYPSMFHYIGLSIWSDYKIALWNTRNSIQGLNKLIADTSVKVAFCQDNLAHLNSESLSCEVRRVPKIDLDAIRLDENVEPDFSVMSAPGRIGLKEKFVALHSSGTTAVPKTVWTTSERMMGLMEYARTVGRQREAVRGKLRCTLSLAPLFHLFGFFEIFSNCVSGAIAVALPLAPTFPPTAQQIRKSLKLSRPDVLSSVPSILQRFIQSDEQGDVFSLLKGTEVAYAGAILPLSVSDALVAHNIPVTSSYGSTEAGVCMATPPRMRRVRPQEMELCADEKFFFWEKTDEVDNEGKALYNLIVRPEKLRDKSFCNRPDGYNSGDLFVKGSEEGLWILLGRSDDVLVHDNGEKTNAAELEKLLAPCRYIDLCQVIGSRRSAVGVLVQLNYDLISKEGKTVEDAEKIVRRFIQQINEHIPAHSRIFDKFIHFMEGDNLETTEKGTLRRRLNEEKLSDVIDRIYSARKHTKVASDVSAEEINAKLVKAIADFLPSQKADLNNTKFTEMGIDSQQALMLTDSIQTAFNLEELSPHLIYEYDTIGAYSQYLKAHLLRAKGKNQPSGFRPSLDEKKIAEIISSTLEKTTHKTIPAAELLSEPKRSTPFTDLGISSQIAVQIVDQLGEWAGQELSSALLFDYPDFKSLLTHLDAQSSASDVNLEDASKSLLSSLDRMTKQLDGIIDTCLVHESLNRVPAQIKNHTNARVVALTGATGALAVETVQALLETENVSKIICLFRGGTLTRLETSFISRDLDPAQLLHAVTSGRIECYDYDMTSPTLGIDSANFPRLAWEVTDFISNAWKMDFNQRVHAFESDCLSGLLNAIRFCAVGTRKTLTFISSVSSIGAYPLADEIPENFFGVEQADYALPMGYGQSKFIGESLLSQAAAKLGMRCTAIRCSQLSGNSKTGAWNTREVVSLLTVAGAGDAKKLPDFPMIANYVPMDVAGHAIKDFVLSNDQWEKNEVRILHISNPRGGDWKQWVQLLKEAGLEFELVSPAAFSQVTRNPESRLHVLAPFFSTSLKINRQRQSAKLALHNSLTLSPSLRQCPELSVELVQRYLNFWRKTGFLKV